MKVTKTHFNIFKKECERLIERWQLKGWRVDFYQDPKMKDARAEISYNMNSRVVSFWMPTEWSDEWADLNEETIKESARHEVIHFMCTRLNELAKCRYLNEEEIYEANEELARLIEHAIKVGL